MNKFKNNFENIVSILDTEQIELRIWHEILEAVYIKKVNDNSFLIYDRYETFTDLDEYDCYSSVKDVGIKTIESICYKYNVLLIKFDDGDSDISYAIGLYVDNRDVEIKKAVNLVAECIDAIFHYAMHQELPDRN